MEKLRKERDELVAIVNTDKYKTIKQLETEKEDKDRSLLTLHEKEQSLIREQEALSGSLSEKES